MKQHRTSSWPSLLPSGSRPPGLAPALSALVFAVGLSLVGCDDRGSQDGLLTTAEKCRNLFIAVCAKDTACGEAVALTDDQCLAQFETDCSKLPAVSDTYDACMSSIPTAVCPLAENLPTPCKQVLLR